MIIDSIEYVKMRDENMFANEFFAGIIKNLVVIQFVSIEAAGLVGFATI